MKRSCPLQVEMFLARAGNQKIEQNELLEAHGERLAGGPAGTAGRRDQAMAPLGTTRPARARVRAKPDPRGMPIGRRIGSWRPSDRPLVEHSGSSSICRPSARSRVAQGGRMSQEDRQPGLTPEVTPQTARAVSSGRSCEGCGAELGGGRPQRRYCDGRCRARASRERQAHKLQDLIGQLQRPAKRRWGWFGCPRGAG